MIVLQGGRKSAPAVDPRIQHIDEWQRVSDRHRDDKLGRNFFEETQQFYDLSGASPLAPRFRPNVSIPELQLMMLREANDLSEFQPAAYIYSDKASERLSDIEKAFKSQWNQMFVPFHLLFAFCSSLFHGTSFLQVGIDPFARNGRGSMWTKYRDPRTVHMDPATDYTLNWSYVILEDRLHLDEIKKRYPEKAKWLPKYPGNATRDTRGEEASSGFRLPDGPFQSMPAFDGGSAAKRGMTSVLRVALFRDYTREMIAPPPENPDAPPKYRWIYPNGRIIVDCEGVVLADGQIPWPMGRFNLIPIWATPPLFGAWAVPPVRYTSNLQTLAERMYGQTFENFYRLNNGIWFIPKDSEIDQAAFGGVAGEKQTFGGTQPPTLVTPPAFPASSLQFPETLLNKQRELHGFTQARQGNPGDGNTSPELFDAAVLRGQGMTQLRGRLASMSVLELSKAIAYTMLAFMPDQKMPLKENGKFEVVDYKRPSGAIDDLEMMLDDGSFHVKAQQAVSRITERLMEMGKLDVGAGLEILGYPDAANIGKKVQETQALAAIEGVASGASASKGSRK